jgi:hypothetical protein
VFTFKLFSRLKEGKITFRRITREMKCHNFFLFPSSASAFCVDPRKMTHLRSRTATNVVVGLLVEKGGERSFFEKRETDTTLGGFTTKPHSPIKLFSVGWQSSVISYNKLCPVSENGSHIVVCSEERLFHHNFLPLLVDSSFSYLISFIG